MALPTAMPAFRQTLCVSAPSSFNCPWLEAKLSFQEVGAPFLGGPHNEGIGIYIEVTLWRERTM